jgi:hypothetical protein
MENYFGIDPNFDDRIKAAVDLIGRTGAQSIQIRFSDDEQPVVWFSVAIYPGKNKYETAAGFDPLVSTLRLCEQLIDGGMCTHCKRPAGLEPNHIEDMPLDKLICWYQYDPELKKFRRGCEGDNNGD